MTHYVAVQAEIHGSEIFLITSKLWWDLFPFFFWGGGGGGGTLFSVRNLFIYSPNNTCNAECKIHTLK